jgi:hypothetical protein
LVRRTAALRRTAAQSCLRNSELAKALAHAGSSGRARTRGLRKEAVQRNMQRVQ